MSVFGVPPQNPPGAAPSKAVMMPGPFASVFPAPADTSQQNPPHPQPQKGQNAPLYGLQPVFFSPQPNPPVLSSHEQNTFNAPPSVFSRTAGMQQSFGSQNTLTVTPSIQKTVLPSNSSASGLSAPVFGVSSAFGTCPIPDNASARSTAPASTSVFQQFSQKGDVLQKPQRSTTFGMPKSGMNTLNPAVALPQPSQPFTMASPVFSKEESGNVTFNPMASGAKRGRGGSTPFGGRGAGRVDVVPSQFGENSPRRARKEPPPTPPQQKLKFSSAFVAPVPAPATKGSWQPRQPVQEQRQMTTGGIATEQLLSTRVFSAFMRKILDESDVIREEAADFLEDAFFGVVGSHGSGEFPTALQQMLAVWHEVKETQPQSSIKGEHWVVLFALGCHVNFLTNTILAEANEQQGTADADNNNNDNTNKEDSNDDNGGAGGQKDIVLGNKWAALTNSCTYANIMCDIFLQLFSNQAENHVPYSVLPFVLRRVRNTFELANDEGVLAVQSNMKTTLLKLYRYVRVPTLQQEQHSVVERQRTAAYACVLGELMLHSYAPSGRDEFVQSFHQHCSNMTEIRCALYHHYAHNLLQESLTDNVIQEAMELLARAFVILPESAKENKRLLFLKLTACGLALGRVPLPEEQEAYDVAELEDLIVAVRSSNWMLFDIAMRNNSEFYVQCGIHNVLQVVGKRISLLMVVKYYVNSFSSRLHVQDMIDYYEMPFTLYEGCHVWLLPLLVEKRINGVMESGVLVLSSANPFDAYSKEALTALATRDQGE
ncbi:hypothetical protein TcYC6_0081810 [Trypanosoma cruzi]|nr:hypothetical protein TcYC6_0081810 [Trypanosoma cruzi]